VARASRVMRLERVTDTETHAVEIKWLIWASGNNVAMKRPTLSVDVSSTRILCVQPPTIPLRQLRPIGPHFLVRALVALPIEHRRSPGFGALSLMMPIQIFRERF
jgi:hypothetical protein